MNTGPADEPEAGQTAPNECDTNADTCCLGSNFIILEYTQRTADVYPYDSSYQPITNVPIVTGATAWTDPTDQVTYILVFNESLYYGTKLDHTLINPNQVRHNGIQLWDNPYDHDRGLCIDIEEGPVIQMAFSGTKLKFQSRAPTTEELSECKHIPMTSRTPWNPNEVQLGISALRSNAAPMAVQVSQMNIQHNPMATSVIQGYEYINPHADEAVLHSIEPTLTNLQDMAMKEVRIVQQTDVPVRHTTISNERHTKATAQKLAESWGIGLKKAEQTLKVTTQRMTRSAILPLSRRYRADRMYRLKRLDSKFSTDTLYADIKSLKQNSFAQVYTHKCGFALIYPMAKANGTTIGQSLRDMAHDYGVPNHLKFDGAMNQVGKSTTFMQIIRELDIQYKVTSPRRPHENPAEAGIRELKRRWYRLMMKKDVPPRLWDYALIWIADTGNLCSSGSRLADNRTPLEIITGETPDISEYLDFGFYDWVTYRTNGGMGELSIGRWLGVSHKVGTLMSYWILTVSGHVISTTTVQRLTNAEQSTTEWQTRMTQYNERLLQRLNVQDSNVPQDAYLEQPEWNRLSTNENDPDFINDLQQIIADESIHDEEEHDHTPDSMDSYLNMELGLPRGDDDGLHHAVVKRRAIDKDGKPIGIANNNPLLDTREYEVEYSDGTTEVLTANIIAENILAQVDAEGHRQLMLHEIIDHRKNEEAISKDKGFTTGRYNTKRRVRTTKGWEMCVSWKDGSSNWIALKDLKNAYPVELAQYATANDIADEPAFAWWVPYVQKKRKAILAKLKSKYWQRTHKYGIRVPKSVKEAYEIDKQDGTTCWHEAIEQEMKKIRGAFDLYDGDVTKLIGYEEITTHFIFDIKLGENFRRKARLVADGHKTSPPSSVTYSSVVSRDSVRICLTIAALNELEIESADIENAYLTAPCREKCWTRGGPEFGSEEGKAFIVRSALYGLKSSGAAFRSFLAETLDEIGFKSSIADPDVWMRAAVKKDGEEYYEYILIYVDDVLTISMDAKRVMESIQQNFKFKKDEIKPPEIYLGAKLEEKELNGKKMWTMTSRDYVKHAIKNVEEQLHKRNMKLPTNAKVPIQSTYQPETDCSEELESDDITFFQELIGMLRWAIEIGRVDIHTEVSMLSSYQASPRRGHLEQVIHIFAFLKKNPKLTLYFDPNYPNLEVGTEVDTVISTPEDFQEIYRDAEEELPGNMPRPRGRSVTVTAFVDASHAACKRTRRSHTGFILFVNRAPVVWFSKRQNTVESSTFSSEFIAMKTCMEHIVSLRYKLRMFGIHLEGPAIVLCDNQSVVNNSSKVESVLNKKHNSIAYHAVRWAVAARTMMVRKIHTDFNLADAMTKRLTVERRKSLFGNWTY